MIFLVVSLFFLGMAFVRSGRNGQGADISVSIEIERKLKEVNEKVQMKLQLPEGAAFRGIAEVVKVVSKCLDSTIEIQKNTWKLPCK